MFDWELNGTFSLDNRALWKCNKMLETCGVEWLLTFDQTSYRVNLTCKQIKGNYLVQIFQKTPDLDENCFSHFYQGNFKDRRTLIYFTIQDYIRFKTCLELKFYEQKIKVDDNKFDSSETDSFSEEKKLENQGELSKDISSFWEKKILSDVVLKCGSEIFKAHKAILAARSTFFEVMFTTPMKESMENIVDLESVKPEILEIFLNYIYSGKLQEMNDAEMICQKLSAADFYGVPGLKRICSDSLRPLLSVSNALSVLVFVEMLDPVLKMDTVEFVCKNFDSLVITEEWSNLQKQNPDLAMIVMSEKIKKLQEIHKS